MKAEHKMGKGEFSYLRDWGKTDDDGGESPPYKKIIASLIEEEVAKQVAGKVAAASEQMASKVDAAVAAAIADMHAKMDKSRSDRAASDQSAATSATLLAKVEGLDATVRVLQAKPQVVQTPQGKIVMQQPVVAKPSAYHVDVARGADGLIKSLDMVPR